MEEGGYDRVVGTAMPLRSAVRQIGICLEQFGDRPAHQLPMEQVRRLLLRLGQGEGLCEKTDRLHEGNLVDSRKR